MKVSPIIALAFVLACLSRGAAAFFDPPHIVPAAPVANAPVYVHIRGGDCDTLISRPGYPRIVRDGNSIRMVFYSVHEDLVEWCIYDVGEGDFFVGPFPAGTYTLQVDRMYGTLFGDVTETLGVLPFTVARAAQPVAAPTLSAWGAIALLAMLMLGAARRLQPTEPLGRLGPRRSLAPASVSA
jgi:hypothetical protein